jgi:hypothetical protein
MLLSTNKQAMHNGRLIVLKVQIHGTEGTPQTYKRAEFGKDHN